MLPEKNQIQHAWVNMHLITRTVGVLAFGSAANFRTRDQMHYFAHLCWKELIQLRV
jgi:hypothetical protein